MSSSGEQQVHENGPTYHGRKIPPTNLTPGFEDTAATFARGLIPAVDTATA